MTQAEIVVMRAFDAVNTRDSAALDAISHPEVAFVWPESLQAKRFTLRDRPPAANWEELWEPFQPHSEFPTRGMDPHIVASSDDRVAVLWRQRGINASGERFDCEVCGLYEVRDNLLYRAQMFYFDGVATQRFLQTTPAPRAD